MTPLVKGLVLMTTGIALLIASDATSKYLVHSHPVGQVIALRQLATLLVIIPYLLLWRKWGELRVRNWGGQGLRGLAFVLGSVFIVWSLRELPLATAITMLFASPIFMVILSAPMLGERIGVHRWVAVGAGFVGVLVIVRPGGESFQWMVLLPLLAAMINAFRDVLTRRLSRSETSLAILFWSNIILMLAGALTIPWGWVAVTPVAAFWFVAAGIFNGLAHFFIIEALRVGEASVVAPMRYTALLWAALLGFVVFGEVPSLWLWAGAAIIVGSSLYMLRGEWRR
jgi:drug/metabolite transporter (DMT)-like permease